MLSNIIELVYNLAILVALNVLSGFIRQGRERKVRLFSIFRHMALLFATFLFVFNAQAAAGITAPKTATRESVRVVMDDNYPPYTFRDSSGTLQGILVDQWALWEKKTGIHVRLDAMDWAKAQQRMEVGDYDVIDTLFANEHRKTLYDFSVPYANIDVPLFFSRELSGIRGPKDLEGFVVGAKNGDSSIEILKASGVANFLLFDNYEAIVAAARDGKIKVFTIDKPPALYFLIKMGIQDQFRESEPLYSGEFHRAVRKGNTALLEDVQQGFNAISKGEYEDIDRRWYGAPLLSKARLTWVAYLAGGSAVIVCLLMLWVWLLRRSVRRRTAELQTDITERKRAEDDLRFIKDLYATLSQANQAIVRCESRSELFREITRTCSESGHFELAWIGEPDETGERILVAAAHGPSMDYLVGIDISTLEQQATGRGPTGTCFREARVAVAQNWDTDSSIESWRKTGAAHGFRSNAAFPISQEGRLKAVLTLYSKEPNFFLPARLQLLAEMANNLGHALEGLATEDLRVRAEEALRESEEEYRRLVWDMQVGVLVQGPQTEILLSNPKAMELLGLSEDQLLGKTSFDPEWRVIHEDGTPFPGSTHPVPQAIALRHPVHKIVMGVSRPVTEDLVWLSVDAEPQLNVDGTVRQVVCTFVDITDLKRVENALRESEERFKALHNASFGGISIHDKGRILQCNQGLSEMTGYSLDELIGMDGLLLIAPGWREFVMNKIVSGYEKPYEAIGIRKNGETFPMQLEARNVHYQGKMVRTVEFRDITERKQAEEERAKLQAQLLQAQKMDGLGSLAGGVAHDMNNVLGAILGMASANIAAQPVGSPAYHAFDTITQAAIRGGKMVKGLLNFARQSPAEEHELDLNAILREEVNLLERTTLAKVRLEVDLASELRPILGDASALTHAFMNLCVNAVDAMPENGTLTLRTRNVDNDWIEVLVEDTGTGMATEILEKAMDPFFTTKEVGKGTGLGLSMVYSTVKAHRGQIEIQSEPGQGTRVRMRFPTCESTVHPPEPAAEAQATSAHGKLNVLLVDDDELIQSTVQAILEILGHTVVTTSSGEEALARLGAGVQPDAVILDMNMPGLGGTGTLPRLRALRPTVPVMLATGRADQAALNLIAAHPHVTLLPKPFSMEELQQHIERLGQG